MKNTNCNNPLGSTIPDPIPPVYREDGNLNVSEDSIDYVPEHKKHNCIKCGENTKSTNKFNLCTKCKKNKKSMEKYIPKKIKWNRIEKELPKKEGFYLVYIEDCEDWDKAYFSESTNQFHINYVSHWSNEPLSPNE